eukprot:jgi/Astpho2/483/e_gw1.00011.43.1_t
MPVLQQNEVQPHCNLTCSTICSSDSPKVLTKAAGSCCLQASKEAQEKQEALLAAVEARRAVKQTVVPTNKADIIAALRTIGEPVTLFGEGVMERTQRLRHLLATMDDDDERRQRLAGVQFEEPAEAAPQKELFYTEGPQDLKAARLRLAHYSLQAAKARIAGAKRKRDDPEEDEEKERDDVLGQLKHVSVDCSERGDDRPLVDCAFSPDGQLLATAAWSGLLKLWGLPACDKRLTIKAHEDRITGLAWHPAAGTHSQQQKVLALATAGSDCTAKLFSGQGDLLRTLTGHTLRLGRLAFHPMGQHLATASYDETWRLWDVETGQSLVEQEGHSRSVYTVAFHRDGSLAASGGLDAIGRVWDLRSGRSIITLEGHVQGILGMDFSPDGYHLASCAEDNTCRIWDLRKRACIYTIPGHKSLVSQVRYDPTDGYFLVTAGFDNVCKIWSAADFQLVRTLAGHDSKVQGLDICAPSVVSQTVTIATAGHDKTVKLWAPEAQFDDPTAVDDMT